MHHTCAGARGSHWIHWDRVTCGCELNPGPPQGRSAHSFLLNHLSSPEYMASFCYNDLSFIYFLFHLGVMACTSSLSYALENTCVEFVCVPLHCFGRIHQRNILSCLFRGCGAMEKISLWVPWLPSLQGNAGVLQNAAFHPRLEFLWLQVSWILRHLIPGTGDLWPLCFLPVLLEAYPSYWLMLVLLETLIH